jgi:fatty acid desaturase
MAQAAHESIHFYMKPAQSLRARVLAYLQFYVLCFTPKFADLHFAHHRHFGEAERDPDYPDYQRALHSKGAFLAYLAEGFLGIRAVKRFLAVYLRPSPGGSKAQRGYGNLVRLALTQMVLAVVFWRLTGIYWSYLALWIAPIMVFVKSLNDLRLLAEHGFFGADGKPVLRGFLKKDIFSHLIAPYGFSEHVEHHLAAAVSWTELKAVRESFFREPERLERHRARMVHYSLEYLETSHAGFLVARFWSLPIRLPRT